MRNACDFDVVIVLGASLKDKFTLSPQTLENLAKLRELNLKKPIILSGGFFAGNKDDTEASLMLREITRSEDFGPIYLETESRDSSDNVQCSLDIIQAFKWKNIMIIDQPLHLFQLKLLFKHYIRLRKLDIKLNFIPGKAVYGGNAKWWQYSHPLVYFIYLMLCTCYYILKGKINLQDII